MIERPVESIPELYYNNPDIKGIKCVSIALHMPQYKTGADRPVAAFYNVRFEYLQHTVTIYIYIHR